MKFQFKALAASSVMASAFVLAQDAVPTTPAAEVAPAAAIAPAVADEVNSVVTKRHKTSAKSIVDADIAAFCKEAGIILGDVTATDATYLKGVERVNDRADSPTFVKSRTMAYEKAYQNAVASYVMNKFGKEYVEQYYTYFNDQSSNRLAAPSDDGKSTVARIAEKAQLLTEAKLDEGLRAMGVTPAGTPAQKRKLMESELIKKSIREAVGASAGLVPVQTFEGWNEANQYAVGVVIRGGAETETMAECLRNKMRPAVARPEKGLTVAEALPGDEELVSQFGVRVFFDKQGMPALLSFAQWGSSYTGTDEDMAEDAMDHALMQAEALANEQLTIFINSTISVKESSEKAEDKKSEVSHDANLVPTLQTAKDMIDRASKTSTMKGSDTMRGRSTVAKKVITHPVNGRKLAVCVRMWSFGQYDAMTRIIEKPKPAPVVVAPAPAVPQGTQGKRRGRAYDF